MARTHQGHKATPEVTAACYLDCSDGIRTQQHKETPTWHLSWLKLLGQRSFHPWCLALLLTRDSSVGHLHCGHWCPETLIWVLSRHLPHILPALICPIIWVPMAASFSSLVLSVASLLLPSHSRFKPNTLYDSRQRRLSIAFHILSRGQDFCLPHCWMLNYWMPAWQTGAVYWVNTW